MLMTFSNTYTASAASSVPATAAISARSSSDGSISPRVLTGAEACVNFDLCHHGRAGAGLTARLAKALADAEPLSRLLEIGAARWGSRVDQLRAEILSRPVLGRHVWDAARSDFVRAGQ